MNFAVYTRKSYYTDTSDSVKMQLEACKDYIARTFPEVDLITPYEDDGYLRSDIDRPAMNRLREDVGAGLIDCVVIYRIDRVCSDMMDFCTFYTYLKEHEVNFVTVKDGIDTTTPMGEAMMYLAVIFAGVEIGNDSLRIRDGMYHLSARGFWCGGAAPLGYKIAEVPDGGKRHKILVRDEAGIATKQMLVALLLDGDMTLQGLETYCRQKGIKSQSGKFLSTTQLHQIFKSPFCAPDTPEIYDYFADLGCIMDEGSPRDAWDGTRGVMVYGRTTEKRVNRKKRHVLAPPTGWRISIGRHEPHMDAETWLRIQAVFGKRKFDKSMKHETTLLKGVLRCKCGRLLQLARKPKTDGSVSTWYHCPRRERAGKEACDLRAIKADLLDEKVLEIFRRVEHDPTEARKYTRVQRSPAPALAPKIRELEGKIERLTASLADAGDRAASKYIVAEIEKLDGDLRKLRTEAAEAKMEERRRTATEKGVDEKAREIAELMRNFDGFTPAEKNEIARRVIRSAVWDGETLFLSL